MRKFFVNSNQIKEDKIKIINEDVNHIKNVLRLKPNCKIKICDIDNNINYICNIEELKEEIICKIIEKAENETESNVKIDIFQGLPKSDKMEFIIQKGTELGVSEFTPVSFKRSIVKLDEKDEKKKIERWQKIAVTASKQSGRDIIPKINKVENVKNICNLVPNYDIVILTYELEENNHIKNELMQLKNLKNNYKIAVIIGPEGGIEEDEINTLKNAGAKVVTLGKRILRTETVALQIASIIMYELEETNLGESFNSTKRD